MSKGVFEAVLFMEDHFVSRQLRFKEFEALLDNMMPLPAMADQEVKAVYVQLNGSLLPIALVFFNLYFDDEGRPDSEWNLPLQRLAKISGTGPDLGAGPVRLACRSQCAISWHQRDLWDPDMRPGQNDFQNIARVLKQNRLGFDVAPEETTGDEDIPVLTAEPPIVSNSVSTTEVSDEHRLKLARTLKEQRLRIKTLESQHEAALEELRRQHSLERQERRREVEELRQSMERHRVVAEQTKDKLLKRNDQLLQLQEEMGKYRRKLSALQRELTAALPEEEAERLKQRMEGELTILKEQLDRRNAELFYREEREEQLQSEIQSLKDELKELGETDMIQQLADRDVVFVAYHAGAGHLTLPVKDIQTYLDNPVRYVAERCFVTEEQYKAWLEHYEDPTCVHEMPGNGVCGKPVTRVAVPGEFVAGISDHCHEHQEA